MKTSLRRALPATILVGAIVVACAWILPERDRNPLLETTVWSLVLVASFAGWGAVVAQFAAPRERVDLGLRVLWGASLLCQIGGLLMAPALMTRTAALTLVEIGIGLAMLEAIRTRERVRNSARIVARFAKRQPRIVALMAIGALVLAIHYLAGIAESHTNPYDDDIAYLPFVKKLLATGTVLEPFSFRRLSALGGQTIFAALVWLRADAAQSNTFDRSMCVLMIAALVAGHAFRRRRVPPLVIAAALAMLLTMPLTAINTASYYSGVAFFLGLYRSLVWASEHEDRAAWRTALPLALVAATACTLRQNYLPIPVFVFASAYAVRLWNTRTARALIEPMWVAGLTLACLVPWLFVAWQSNRTFLYPIMPGTFNKALALNASDWSIFRELKMNVGVFLEGMPARSCALFVVAWAFSHEREDRRPLLAFAIGIALGFLAVVHGFSQSDPGNIGRYVFGSVAAFMLAVMLGTATAPAERASARFGTARLSRSQIALGIALVGCAAQVVDGRDQLLRFYNRTFANVEMLWHRPGDRALTRTPEFWLYGRLQGSVPANARLAVLLDEPYYLDFRRNPIWNLDMPGYSSLPPAMPFFQGAEKLEEYFREVGIRYLAFVRPDTSRYHYRRAYWVGVLVDEAELWRSYAPYLIDFLDNLTTLSDRHKKLFEERGLVVLDLAEAP
ncbi:MAG TPA: hypothetical protein VM580_19860 [Labilithrix sp.]|nr:hypothetical protein [Labilithrix sp.]